MAAFKKNGIILEFASKRLLNYEAFLIKAVNFNAMALKFVSYRL